MNGVKYFITTILSICIVLVLNANTKGKSGLSEKKPKWILTSQANYIVVSGVEVSLDKAKSKAKDSLKNFMIDFALNQMNSKNPYFKQIKLKKESATQLLLESNYFSAFDTRNHEVFYWQKLKNKESKIKHYHYYIQHYLDEVEIDSAINKIAYDHKISVTFEEIKRKLKVSNKSEDIYKIKMDLTQLSSTLSEEDKRKEECEKLLTKTESIFNNIEVKEMLNVPGKLIVCQTFNDRAIITSKPPLVKSTSIMVTNIENFDEQWIINYKYIPSHEKSSDIIKVEFENGGIKKANVFEIKSFEEKVEIKLSGAPIIIKRNRMIKFYIASSYRGDAVLERIIINYNQLQFTDTKLNQLINGAGMYTIRFVVPPGFHKIKIEDKVNGELHYKSKLTGKKEIFYFYNQKLETVI